METTDNNSSTGTPSKRRESDGFKYLVVDARHCCPGKISYWEIMLECIVRRPGDIFVEHVFITLAPSTINPGGICYIVRDESKIDERKRFRLNYRNIDLDAFPSLDDIGEVYRKELWDLVSFHESMKKEFPEVIFVAPLLSIINKHRELRGLSSENDAKKETQNE